MSPKEHEDLHKQEIESWKEVFIGWKHEPSPLISTQMRDLQWRDTYRKEESEAAGALGGASLLKAKGLGKLRRFQMRRAGPAGHGPNLGGLDECRCSLQWQGHVSLYLANFWMEEGKAMLSWWLWNVTWWKKWFGWGWFIPQELHLDMDKMLLCYVWLKFESLNCTR